MTRITWIRHGEPSQDVLGTHYGQSDVDLSDAGRAQSAALAERLQETTFDAVWSSDLARARCVADLLAAARGLTVQVEPALRERHLGVFQGMTYAEAQAKYPDHATRLRTEGESHRVPEGENIEDLAARVIPAIEAIVKAHEGQCVAIAAHGGPIRAAIGHALDVPFANLARLRVDYCGVSIIEYSEGRPRVICQNV
jgi:broad specificity phosphatase PhoE